MNSKRTILIGLGILVALALALALLAFLLGPSISTLFSRNLPSPPGSGTALAPPGPDVTTVDEAPNTCPGYGPLELAHQYYETFDSAWDRDWYFFTATAGALYTIRLDDLENKADTMLYLYVAGCADPNPIRNDNCVEGDPGSGSCITWRAPASGTYHIYVRNYKWYTNYGTGTGYTLTVQEN